MPVNANYKVAINHVNRDIGLAKDTEKNVKKHLKDTKNVTSRKQAAAKEAYAHLSADLTAIRQEKKFLIQDKKDLTKAYEGAGGKRQKIKDFFKYCWGPKAKIRTEIRHLDSLQRTVEKKMAKLDPEKFIKREHTLISQDKVEKKLIREELKELRGKYKDYSRALKNLESFGKMKAYIEMKPQNPKKAVKDFKSLSPKDRFFIRKLDAFPRVEAEMKRKPLNPQKVQNEMEFLRMEIKNNLPEFRERVKGMRDEINELKKDLHPRKKLGYVEI